MTHEDRTRRAWEIQQEAEQLQGGRQDDQDDEGDRAHADFMNQDERNNAPLHAEDDRTAEEKRRDDVARSQFAHFHPQFQHLQEKYSDEEWEEEEYDPQTDFEMLAAAKGWD